MIDARLVVLPALCLLACSQSHRNSPGDDGGMTALDDVSCEGGLFLGENQAAYPPTFGLMSSGHVWFSDGNTLSLASPELVDVEVLADSVAYEPVVSMSGDQIAFRRDAELVVREVVSGREISVAAVLPHNFGFVPSPEGPERAWSCGDGVLTIIGSEPAIVARDVSNCSALFVSREGPTLGWLDASQSFHWLHGDATEPQTLRPHIAGTTLRPGAILLSADGRWILHQPALPCDGGGVDCGFEGARYVGLHDASTGDHVVDIDLGVSSRRASLVEAPDTLVVHANAGRIIMIGTGGGQQTFEGYRPQIGLSGGRILARSADDTVHLLSMDGSVVELARRDAEADLRMNASPDGSHFAIAHATGRDNEWELLVGSVDAEAWRWLGSGYPELRGVTDTGHVLITGFFDASEPADGRGRHRVVDSGGRELASGLGEVGAVDIRGARLAWATVGGGLHTVNGAGSHFRVDAVADDLFIDSARSRVLRLRSFPEEEEEISDLGPSTRFCLFASYAPAGGS